MSTEPDLIRIQILPLEITYPFDFKSTNSVTVAGVAANFTGFAATGVFGAVPLIQELFQPPAD